VSGTRPPACAESESWGAELALGLLAGSERAAGLSHLASCPSCREQVDELARVADRLLLLAPEAEPPTGFESRVLGAVAGTLGGGPDASSRRAPRAGGRRRVALVAASAALVVTAAVGGGLVAAGLGSDTGSGPTALRTGLAVSASGRTSCRVVVAGGRPASVLVSLDGYPGADTDVTVEVETVEGTTLALGPLHVAGGHGLLVRTLDVDGQDVSLMRMLDREGRVVYEATLHDHHTFASDRPR
jgi:hypothetical protein